MNTKPAGLRKATFIRIRVRSADAASLASLARAAKLSLSAYIRKRLGL